MSRALLAAVLCFALHLAAQAEAPSTGRAEFTIDAGLTPAEQYRRLSLILLISEGVDAELVDRIRESGGDTAPGAIVDPGQFKTPLIRIVDQQTLLSGALFLFQLGREHGVAIGSRLEALRAQHAALRGPEFVDAVREDAVLVRNAIADSLDHAGLGAGGDAGAQVDAYRLRTLELRNLMEFEQFDRELARITDEAITAVGGKLEAYQRMFDDETGDDSFDRQIRAAEYRYAGRAKFDEDAARVAEEVIEGVVIQQSRPDSP